MIKKIIIFSDFIDQDQKFLKSSSNLRITYTLRKLGYDVLTIHHMCSFTKFQIESIINRFANNEQILICLSTSFTVSRSGFWSDKTYDTILNICKISKRLNHKLFVGGWVVTLEKFKNDSLRKIWNIDTLSSYVDYFVIGNSIDVIDSFCKDKEINFKKFKNSNLIFSNLITDYSDCASSPSLQDRINNRESLLTEIAAGCIFSCSFCNYGVLGKKQHEYSRTYDSLKQEIISNYENFGTTFYMFTDNIVNDWPEKIKYLVNIKDETGIDLRWVGYLRLDSIKNKNQILLLKESGIAGCFFGLESFKPEVGKYIGKITDGEKLKEKLHLFRDIVGDECLTLASFISGLPTETEEDLDKTFDWLHSKEGYHLIDNYRFSTLRIFEDIENKNEINRARNNPFRDYKNTENWISPWGTFESFSKKSKSFNQKQKTMLNSFNIPIFINLGFSIETILKMGRQKLMIPKEVLNKKTEEKLKEYVNKTML